MNDIDRIIEVLDNAEEPQPNVLNDIYKIADSSFFARKSNTELLIGLLDAAFEYTTQNNYDLIADASFPYAAAKEEIEIEASFKKLTAFLYRNQKMFDQQIADNIDQQPEV